MKKEWVRKYLPYLVAAIIFIALACIYCSPIFEGKVINQPDIKNWEGMVHECRQYTAETGNYSWWTGSMFSGMPTFQIGGGKFPSPFIDIPLGQITRIGFTGILAMIIGYFIGYFILLRSFKLNKWLCIIGSIAITFSSYFFIIIAAGHSTKAYALGLLPPIIAGFYLIFQKKYGWGIAITLIYTSISLMLHPQMTFYICMLIGILFCAELFIHIKDKRWKDLAIGTMIFGLSFVIGAGTQYASYAVNKEYSKETMRGGHSELVKDKDVTNKTSGLDIDYATQWSYGIGETMTFMIPNFMGASSNYNIGNNSKIHEELVSKGVPRSSADNFCTAVPTYWGNQPFTSGPVYMGAIVCFLFLLGLLIVKGPYKWAILVATIFSVMLSWGHNFMPLTRLFFDYFPMYNKFRAVSSILVVAEITIPLLGFLAVKTIMDKKISQEEIIRDIYISAGITGGVCLFFAIFGKAIFSFTSPNDTQLFSQIPQWLGSAIISERAVMLRSDAFRSFIFILLGSGILWLYTKEKLKFGYFVTLLGVLILADMWTVDKRFFNNDNFVAKKEDKNYFNKMPYEEDLLQDKDPDYRVFNLSTNTFNESRTSYYFKSLGGYHGAKLRRYQDLIDEHISKIHLPVINMLNAKYIIVKGNDGQPQPRLNPDAMGNAWYVDSLVQVSTPNEESDALNTINVRNTAVVDTTILNGRFAPFCKDFVPGHDSTATIKLTKYAPDYVEYQSSSSKQGMVIFSEIYYPYGWNAYIDGKPVDHFRANYTLRGLDVPAGNHHIRFEFRPQTVEKAGRVANGCKYAMYVILLGIIGYSVYDWRKKKKAEKIGN